MNSVQISAQKFFSFIGETDTKYKHSLLLGQTEDLSFLYVGIKITQISEIHSIPLPSTL